jgi:hypothetical protein
MGYVDLDLKTKIPVFIWCESWSYKVYDRLETEEFKENDYCQK